MSQHYFETSFQGKPATITMGWDRPLQGHFLLVETDDPGAEEEFIYSNLFDPALLEFGGLPPSLDYFKAKLTELGLNVPEPMVREIELDAINNVGNRHVWYDQLGNIAKHA